MFDSTLNFSVEVCEVHVFIFGSSILSMAMTPARTVGLKLQVVIEEKKRLPTSKTITGVPLHFRLPFLMEIFNDKQRMQGCSLGC